MAINMTKSVCTRLEQAQDTLRYCTEALKELDSVKGEIKLQTEIMNPIEKLEFEELLTARLKKLNDSLRVSLAFCYHIN